MPLGPGLLATSCCRAALLRTCSKPGAAQADGQMAWAHRCAPASDVPVYGIAPIESCPRTAMSCSCTRPPPHPRHPPAGTYFPPADSYGRPGFKTVLRKIAQVT